MWPVKRVLVTGAAGFIGQYLVNELLNRGYHVIGLDNGSKYGDVEVVAHPEYEFVKADGRDVGLLTEIVSTCDQFVAGAAMVGGVGYIHELPYDILATNERLTAAACDAGIAAHAVGCLQKVTYVGSSMVFDSATTWPTPEGLERKIAPPRAAYGFQKLAVEYFARAAYDQYGLPFTIVRPFNCVGAGEFRAKGATAVRSGDVELVMNHVVPDMVHKLLLGQNPLRILGGGTQRRNFTSASDIAAGIATAIEHPRALNEDFNISSSESTTILELAQAIWTRVLGPDTPFNYVSDEPYEQDVEQRDPDVSKARDLLGFEATTPLESMLDEVVPWVMTAYKDGRL
jgi:nucleoside-diphosphate-sugar epimerase